MAQAPSRAPRCSVGREIERAVMARDFSAMGNTIMHTWGEFQKANPELAQFGVARLHGQVAYLGTISKQGLPRVHPVTPIIGADRLWLFMEPTSPKGADLRRGSGYTLHASVADTAGSNGEFYVAGSGQLIEEPVVWHLAAQHAPYTPRDRYVLFELSVERAVSTLYTADGPQRIWWRAPAAAAQ